MEKAPGDSEPTNNQADTEDGEYDFSPSRLMAEAEKQITRTGDEMLFRSLYGPTGQPPAEDQPGSSAEHPGEPDLPGNAPDAHPDVTSQQ